MFPFDALLCLHYGQLISEVGRQGHKPDVHCVTCYVERAEGQVACTVIKFMEEYSSVLHSSTLVARFPAVFGTHLVVPVNIHIILSTPLTSA